MAERESMIYKQKSLIRKSANVNTRDLSERY